MALAGVQGQPPPAQLQAPEAAQAEFVTCVQTIEIVAKCMNKKQQMRWNRMTVQPFLDVRTAVLDGTLEQIFRHRYPSFRPANDKHGADAVAA